MNDILEATERYYSDKVRAHGATARGVDWSSLESQQLRFEQVLKVCDTTSTFSINDYGCGYGALATHMLEKGYAFEYRGFDISEAMIAKAKALLPYAFFSDRSSLATAEYTVASGIFNVKQQTNDEDWTAYVLRTLSEMAGLSSKGFAFNVLTKYSDLERMRPDLYYADPLLLFDYCKKNFSKHVSLLHDYPLYEFTMLVRG